MFAKPIFSKREQYNVENTHYWAVLRRSTLRLDHYWPQIKHNLLQYYSEIQAMMYDNLTTLGFHSFSEVDRFLAILIFHHTQNYF